MLWKSLLTGTLLAGLAGAVVYFGSGGEFAAAGVKSDFRQAVTETRQATKSVAEDVRDSASETIDKMTDASENFEAEVKEKLSSEDEPPKSKNAPLDDSEAEDNNKSEKKWLDRYLKKNDDSERSDENTSEKAPINIDNMDSNDVDGTVRDILKNGRENPNAKDSELEDAPQQPDSSEVESQKDAMSLDINAGEETKAVYETALAETKDIGIVELRDRAYLSLIDYTIRKKDFERSKAVISEISQPELRDTARSNIAVGLARRGKRDAAFAILEDVETQALADVLRLQVIEAMTAPSKSLDNTGIATN